MKGLRLKWKYKLADIDRFRGLIDIDWLLHKLKV